MSTTALTEILDSIEKAAGVCRTARLDVKHQDNPVKFAESALDDVQWRLSRVYDIILAVSK